MIKRFILLAGVFAAGLGLVDVSGTLGGAPAAAAESVSRAVAKPLSEAQELLRQGKFQEALAKAKEAQALPNRTAYDDYAINDTLAIIYVNLGDYQNATIAYQAVTDSGFVAEADMPLRVKTLAQLYYQIQNYDKALEYGERYLRDYGQDLDLLAIVTNVYYTRKENEKAFTLAKQLVAAADQTGAPPKEAWLQLLLYTAGGVKNTDTMKATLLRLVELYPSKGYWHDLTGIMYNFGGRTSQQGLEIYRLMFAADAMQLPTEYLVMANHALTLGLPAEAKQVLELANSRNALTTAADLDLYDEMIAAANADAPKDAATLDSRAATASTNSSGDADIAIAESYASHKMWDKAIEAAVRGLGKPNKFADQGNLTLGRAYFNLARYDEAKAAFAKVSTDAKLKEVAHGFTLLVGNRMAPPASAPTEAN